ncbi:MAG TPA: DNA-directed RNA polymerase subunit beta [Longimicrobiales bacterium]|nr:DNA-directed RNA polymerase subunit beta [Longimicrobiales bacterium]
MAKTIAVPGATGAPTNGSAGNGGGVPPVSFSKLPSSMAMPNMLDVQVRAFRSLLQTDAVAQEREDVGLERVFNEVFPITDVNNKFSLEFVNYSLGEPKYSVEECIERDMTFAAPLKSTLRLVVWEESEEEERRPKDIIEKEVYLGDLPLLTDLGTFIINGSERVIVSQLHRSPGVVFEESVHPNGTKLFSARIIPFRGSWVEFTVDIHDVIFVHIDKKKKFPATALLRAFGYGRDEDVLRLFYTTRALELTDDMLDNRAQRRDVFGTLLATEVVDPETGEVIAEIAEELTPELFGRLRRAGVSNVTVFSSGSTTRAYESPLLKNTLRKDPTANEEDALRAIYTLLRPGEAPNVETARVALERIFFNPKRYDLGRVGRYKINQRLGVNRPAGETVLTQEDFIAIIRYLIDLHEGRGFVDDIDHLGNRRIRSVGELIANQFSVGLSRMARLVKERMSITTDVDKMNIDDLVNARTVSAVIQAFFGSSQLSQFMDQTNPLAELTHKRRLSALGPGGLTRERAGFEVRDVHYSHYGRMCPIETPEGPNIGLISSLTTYARVNDLGFIETPYRRVNKGKVSDEMVWLDANAEENASIAQANAPLNSDGTFQNEFVLCRQRGDFPLLPPDDIDFMDVAPDQLVSVAAALIPFLEHDDANRALMGSNMQRQAVPLLYPTAPLVGTGLEEKIARDSGAVILARRAGVVQRVTADEIIIDTGAAGGVPSDEPLAKLAQYDRYRLKKYWRTNQDTAINQRPLVQHGQRVEAGHIIADGASTDHGELALGRNVVVAFMPWYGHNFEDAIVISEKTVKDDIYTSIHIQELELHVRDTKRGMEEITREIPNVAEESLTHLDERGIVRIGARVKSGDILVGKITPKGETELSPEEKLLTAIFGEKAKDVKDSSLKMPPGMEGTIIDVKVFSRRIDDPLLEKERGERIGQLRSYERDEILRISEARDEELKEHLRGQTVTLMLKRGTVEPFLEEGTALDEALLGEIDLSDIDLTTLKVQNRDANERLRRVINEAKSRIEKVRERTEEQIDKVFQPDELSPGVVQLVKVYVAEKRKVSVGDKMAGRHGNKGIVARIVPEEDLPFLPDGTPVDIVLNPLGVPSRMNVGQILETTLGWACQLLGFEAKTPVFQGATEDEVGALLKIAGAKWAHRALGVTSVEFPEFSTAQIAAMLASIYKVGGGHLTTASSDSGVQALGRSIDDYLAVDLPKDVLARFEQLRDYLIAARAEIVGRAENEGMAQKFRSIEALDAKKTLKGGLDDAIVDFLTAAGLTPYGKIWLRDGRTGEQFDYPVTVGVIYMLKLSHLVDDKIHARSIGPYSLVTQQPLAGKAQFGGQRFGEMEVWALEAYGAAHTLQEILTVKSDDVAGRSRVYEAIVKGENLPEPGIPESFNVLVKELQSLGLSVTLGRDEV